MIGRLQGSNHIDTRPLTLLQFCSIEMKICEIGATQLKFLTKENCCFLITELNYDSENKNHPTFASLVGLIGQIFFLANHMGES